LASVCKLNGSREICGRLVRGKRNIAIPPLKHSSFQTTESGTRVSEIGPVASRTRFRQRQLGVLSPSLDQLPFDEFAQTLSM
jgi:hypothetical protein